MYQQSSSVPIQNYARKMTIPIDAIDFDFIFIDGDLPSQRPEDGHLTYGPFLEGCAWSMEEHSLCESDPKVQTSSYWLCNYLD